jgi:hypothetical protein
MSSDNLSSVSQNVLIFYQPLTGAERRISMPPYNIVAGCIINWKTWGLTAV